MSYRLTFLTDPQEFLGLAGQSLAAEPVTSTIVSIVTDRAVRDRAAGQVVEPDFPMWWLVVRDGSGAVVGAGMRTAPSAPHPAYLLAMPEEAARGVAEAVHARGEVLTSFNGSLAAVHAAGRRMGELTGSEPRVVERLRLFELGTPVEPARPEGRLRPAMAADVDLVIAWFEAFGPAADAQGERGGLAPTRVTEDPAAMLRRIADQEFWLWQDASGQVVHLTAFRPPSFGVARVAPVYTPEEHRGRGFAGATVAAVSRMLADRGARVTLYTDQANPVSNHLYPALGFRAVQDEVKVELA